MGKCQVDWQDCDSGNQEAEKNMNYFAFWSVTSQEQGLGTKSHNWEMKLPNDFRSLGICSITVVPVTSWKILLSASMRWDSRAEEHLLILRNWLWILVLQPKSFRSLGKILDLKYRFSHLLSGDIIATIGLPCRLENFILRPYLVRRVDNSWNPDHTRFFKPVRQHLCLLARITRENAYESLSRVLEWSGHLDFILLILSYLIPASLSDWGARLLIAVHLPYPSR